MGSLAPTRGLRRAAVTSALGVVEKFTTALIALEAVSNPTPPSHTKSGQKRNRTPKKSDLTHKRPKNEPRHEIESEDDVKQSGWGESREVKVARAYALEACVGLCCLQPLGGERSDGATMREDVVSTLEGWHDR